LSHVLAEAWKHHPRCCAETGAFDLLGPDRRKVRGQGRPVASPGSRSPSKHRGVSAAAVTTCPDPPGGGPERAGKWRHPGPPKNPGRRPATNPCALRPRPIPACLRCSRVPTRPSSP